MWFGGQRGGQRLLWERVAWSLLRQEESQEAWTCPRLVREDVPLKEHSELWHFVGNMAFKGTTYLTLEVLG